jgi:paraquat-inducible protein B
MAKKSNPKMIGAFVVGAVALAIGGIVAFGGGKFLTEKGKAVLYFSSSSLSGLDVGSPVTFRGVKIGSVTDVIIQYDVDKQILQIPVYAEIEIDRIHVIRGERSVRNMTALIERGLRAQLEVQSLVTGQASIDLDFHPGTPVRLVGGDKSVTELPTIPSDIDQLKSTVTAVLQKIAALPLDQITSELLKTVQTTTELVSNVNAQIGPRFNDLKGISDEAKLVLHEARTRLELREGEPLQNLNKTLTDAQRLVNNADKGLAPIYVGADRLVKSTIVTLEQAQRTLQTAQATISPDSNLYFQINRTLVEIQSTASSIRILADYLQRNPNALLTGKRLP